MIKIENLIYISDPQAAKCNAHMSAYARFTWNLRCSRNHPLPAAEELSFLRAAERLFITTTAVEDRFRRSKQSSARDSNRRSGNVNRRYE